MLKSVKVMALLLVLLSTPSGIHAQDCKDLLAGGVFDELIISDERAMANYMRSRLCESSASSTNGTLKLPLPKLPAPIGFEFGTSSSSDVCSDTNTSSESWQAYFTWVKTASPVLADAFAACMNAPGLQIWVERSSARDRFRLRMQLRIEAEGIPPAKVRVGFAPEDIVSSCTLMTPEQLKQGFELSNFQRLDLVCEIDDPSRGVDVALASEVHFSEVGTLEVAPLRIAPVFAFANQATGRNGVEVPPPGSVNFAWSPAQDTLIDAWVGGRVVMPEGGRRWASWNLNDIEPGKYDVYGIYAAAQPRPLDLLVDDDTRLSGTMGATTGGWSPGNRTEKLIGEVEVTSTTARIRLEGGAGGASWPHFHALRFVYKSAPDLAPDFVSPVTIWGR